jgi:hypothetical protein
MVGWKFLVICGDIMDKNGDLSHVLVEGFVIEVLLDALDFLLDPRVFAFLEFFF